MKKIIAFVLILVSLSSYSQTEVDLMRGWGRNKSASIPSVTETDTMPCIMLVCDTAFKDPHEWNTAFQGHIVDIVFSMRGFAVYRTDTIYHTYPEFVGYLDGEKKPVKLFVLMSKDLK